MRITRGQLRQIVREEARRLAEGGSESNPRVQQLVQELFEEVTGGETESNTGYEIFTEFAEKLYGLCDEYVEVFNVGAHAGGFEGGRHG
jgi:hypothetical protein